MIVNKIIFFKKDLEIKNYLINSLIQKSKTHNLKKKGLKS